MTATRTALISGGTGGIGSAIALMLAARGHDVAFTYRNNAAAAAQLSEKIRSFGVSAHSYQMNLDREGSITAAASAAINDLESLTTLVHAAGPHVPMTHLSRVTPAVFSEQLNQEAAAFFTLVHTALPALRESSGSAVAVTTAATDRFPIRDGLSAGTKGAVEQLIRGFAAEEGRYGVRFNAVGPGMLTDGMAERLIASADLDPHALDVTMSRIPLKRFGSAVDIAEAVCFLASDAAGFISGQKLNVDGGYTV
ncbi:SDR family NAD(P)-dependent oxidoreductase [Rhodococcus sp. ARC_M6]|uniref:SDR family NAD(P)-dependent oxidoreductase n=1 Tax=Rhodococcus sp. ARC_M6 TaxID=2928852 RepID=UPI001FB4ED9B|nr:SDR family oxidoreductase [Rhodococcus sp. ARC_M6]MCJ0903045.1 SDR family oxidoreductase [Rhodococcus sp. ARC_M6]